MSYKFEVYRNDVILKEDDSSRNYGRNFITTFPIVMWYANMQFNQRNLFDDFKLPLSILKKSNLPDSQVGSLGTLINSVISASTSMPKELLGVNGVNTDLAHWGISRFNNLNTRYDILILEGSLEIRKDNHSDISVEDYLISCEFAEKYFKMVGDYNEMDPFRPIIKYIYKRLKQEGG